MFALKILTRNIAASSDGAIATLWVYESKASAVE